MMRQPTAWLLMLPVYVLARLAHDAGVGGARADARCAATTDAASGTVLTLLTVLASFVSGLSASPHVRGTCDGAASISCCAPREANPVAARRATMYYMYRRICVEGPIGVRACVCVERITSVPTLCALVLACGHANAYS